MSMLTKQISITGVVNTRTAAGVDLESTQVEPKRVIACFFVVSIYQDSDIEAYVDREKVHDIPDYLVDTWEQDATAAYYPSTSKTQRWDVDRVLEIGQKFDVSLNCGATANNLRGVILYSIGN